MNFLTLDYVLQLQCHLVATYGGEAGVRDRGLLESAIAMPQAMFGGEYLHKDIFEMAAAYLFHITKNHQSLTTKVTNIFTKIHERLFVVKFTTETQRTQRGCNSLLSVSLW